MRLRSWVAVAMVMVVLVGVVPRPASANPVLGQVGSKVLQWAEGIIIGAIGSCLYDWQGCKQKINNAVVKPAKEAIAANKEQQKQFVEEQTNKGFNCSSNGWASNCTFDRGKYERQQQRLQEDGPWMGW